MRSSVVLSVLALVAGCGSVNQPEQQQSQPGAQPAASVSHIAPSGQNGVNKPLDFVNYPIDANQGVDLYASTFAITTNGTDWILTWTGDDAAHEFAGYVQTGGAFSNVVADGLYDGDVVQQDSQQEIFFDAITDGSNVQDMQFSSNTSPVQFDIFIDGIPAAYQVVFSSGGVESTSAENPFDLTPSGAAVGRPVQPAPSFAPKTPGKGQAPRTQRIEAPKGPATPATK